MKLLLLLYLSQLTQNIPTTAPASESPYWQFKEKSHTIVAYHFRSNTSYDPVTGKWWNAGWYDTFIFIPGYNWTPVYGWEPIHLSDDGRWLILRKYPEKPRVLAVLPYMENQRNIVWWKCDFNRNGKLDQSDFSIIQTNLSLVGPAITDLNGDGVTDEEDMSIFHRNYKSQNP